MPEGKNTERVRAITGLPEPPLHTAHRN